jgi:tRNA_anti-like
MPRDYDDRDDRDDESRARRKRPRSDDENDDDRRPRRDRPREDDDSDRTPPRRRRRDRDDGDDFEPRSHSPQNQVSILGIFALVKGIGALLASFMPCMGVLAIIPGALAVLLGTIGLIVAKKSNGRQGTGLPIAGLSVGAAAILVACLQILILRGFSKSAEESAAIAQKDRQERQSKAEAEVKSGPAITITAAALDKEFSENAVRADSQYKGKTLEVTGVVVRVTRDDDEIVVELRGTTDSTVDCVFRKTKEAEVQVASLKVGSQVKIRGKCKGDEDGSVMLEGCMLVTGVKEGK